MSRQYTQKAAEERRLAILQAVDQSGQQQLGLGIVYNMLDEIGCPTTLADLRADVQFLEEQRLIETEVLIKGVTLLRLTQLGAETARGKRRHEGVERADVMRKV